MPIITTNNKSNRSSKAQYDTPANFRIWGAVIAVCLIAFAAIVMMASQISEHVPHSEDEAAYLFQAELFALNRLTTPTPTLADAFWSPFVLDYQGRRFGKYHIGWPLLLNLGIRINAPWLVNALLGSVTLGCIAWLCGCYYSNDAGARYLPLLTAGLGLVTPGFLFLSGSLLSHSASLFWVTLSLLALYYLVEGHRPTLFALLTGAFVGAAFITRPFAALSTGLAIGIFLLVLIARGKLNWTVLLWLVLGGLPVALLLPLFWWAVTGNPLFNAYTLVWPYDRVGFGPNIGAQGYTLHSAIFINTRLKLVTLATGLFGWPGWSNLLFMPVPFLFRRANRWDWLLLGALFFIIFVHIFYWAFGGADGGFPRYYYDALPAFLILTARGIQILGQRLGRWRPPLRGLPLVLVLGFTAYNFIWNLPPLLVEQKGKYDISPAQLEAVANANLSTPALILVQDVHGWNDFAAPFAANSPLLNGPVLYAIDWGDNFTRQLRAHYAGRECWQLRGADLRRCP